MKRSQGSSIARANSAAYGRLKMAFSNGSPSRHSRRAATAFSEADRRDSFWTALAAVQATGLAIHSGCSEAMRRSNSQTQSRLCVQTTITR